MTHTYATLEVSPSTYREIKRRLTKLGRGYLVKHTITGEYIDTDGLSLRAIEAKTKRKRASRPAVFHMNDNIIHVNRGPCIFIHYCGSTHNESMVMFDRGSGWERVTTILLRHNKI